MSVFRRPMALCIGLIVYLMAVNAAAAVAYRHWTPVPVVQPGLRGK